MSTPRTTVGTARDVALPPAQHVVLGAGAVGRALAAALARRGTGTVRVVSRTGPRHTPDGVQAVSADVTDPAAVPAATHGARVVYQVMAPPYHRWAEQFPALQEAAITAAEAAGARLVTLENLYPYGEPQDGVPLTEDTPFRPRSRKGEVRAAMHRDLRAAADAGRVEIAVGRAASYVGPGGGAQSPLGDQVVRAALTGGRARVLGDPDTPHSVSYIPDIAEGLAVLGEHPAAAGRVWHLPTDPAVRTMRQMIDTLYRLAGRGPARLAPTPAWVLRLVGRFQPPVGEVVEMLYEYQRPFVVDSSRITAELGVRATPLDDALAATLAGHR